MEQLARNARGTRTHTTTRKRAPTWCDALIEKQDLLWARVRHWGEQPRADLSERATYILSDSIQWLAELPPNSIHAVVTDPPYGVIEYEKKDHAKLRAGKGGVWRIPPSFDGVQRKPLPRFTVLSKEEISGLYSFFGALAYGLQRALVPGGHIFIASNPLLSSLTFHAFQQAGLEKRGELIRLVQTLRGGDRPKGAEEEFSDVSMMPRSCWEPWGIFRKPLEGTAAQNLRKWGAGGLRRISEDEPFKDVITCYPTRGREKEIAPHPSLKPQRFMRQVVRAALPLGIQTEDIHKPSQTEEAKPQTEHKPRTSTNRAKPRTSTTRLEPGTTDPAPGTAGGGWAGMEGFDA